MSNTPKVFSLGKFSLQLSIFTIVLYAAQTYVISNSFPKAEFQFETWEIYVFQFITVAAVIYFLNRQKNNKPEKVLSTYLILSMLKMGAVLLFLLPLFLDKSLPAKPTVFSFFVAFFLFLFLETRFALKILNQK